jgi:hypothetical protein
MELTSEQLERLRHLENPNCLYDDEGNVFNDTDEIINTNAENKMTYFILKRWAMPVKKYI